MSLLSSHDQQHLARMFAQEQRVNGLYAQFIYSVAPELRKWKDSGRTNVWLRNSAIENLIDKRLIEFKTLLENEIKNGSLRAWDLSDEKNDRLVENYIKNLSISETAKNGMFVRNADALAGFQNRVENGLTLSDKVWNITEQTKGNVELYLQSGVGTGQSAETISRDIKQLLNEPDKVFRRIRDKNGNLIPSKPMKDYHPGAGTYRSSKKNAMRVAATETNMGYRVADSERWKTLDFVLGFEIKRSGNGGPCSVCDSLKGKYPKGFIFSGWHSWCICFAVPILMGHDDFADFLLSDSIPANQLITEIPKGAEEWLAANEKLVEKSYWKKANTEIIKNGITPIEKQKAPASVVIKEVKAVQQIEKIPVEQTPKVEKAKKVKLTESDYKKITEHYEGYMDEADFDMLKAGKSIGLNDNETNLMYNYSDRLYKTLNQEIYTGNKTDMTDFVVDRMNATMDKLKSYKGNTFRGMNVDNAEQFVSQLESGETFRFDTFTSSSKDMNVVQDFLDSRKEKVIFSIESKTGKEIDKLSMVPEEQEVLFKAGTKFKFISKNKMGDTTYVKISEL